MSLSVVNSVKLTDKFKKELERFFEWTTEHKYILKDINNEEHEWNMKLLSKFHEPGRNKLEAYIKSLFTKYTISLNGYDIEDAKLLTKEFKDNKNNKKLKLDDEIRLDMSIDTSKCYNIDTLNYWTKELIKVFGKPEKTGEVNKKYTWEWKLSINGMPYSIYNWNANKDSYEESTWYLGGVSDSTENIKKLVNYIDNSINKNNYNLMFV